MLKMLHFAATLALVFLFCLSVEPKAHAYVDPGSGLFLIQSLSSICMGIVYYFRKRIKALIRGAEAPMDHTAEMQG